MFFSGLFKPFDWVVHGNSNWAFYNNYKNYKRKKKILAWSCRLESGVPNVFFHDPMSEPSGALKVTTRQTLQWPQDLKCLVYVGFEV